jgi:ribosomal protein S10
MQTEYYSLKISSTNNRVLTLYKEFLKKNLNRAKAKYSFVFLPKTKKSFSLLKSPHVYKKAIENFEFVKYKIVCFIEKSIHKRCLQLFILNKPKTLKMRFSLKKVNVS